MDIELSQIILNSGMAFLAIVTAIVVGVVGYYLVKLLKDVSSLTKNINETSLILNNELKPTLNELTATMKSINSIIKTTDDGVGSVKSGLSNLVSRTKLFSGNVINGFIKGFMTVYSLFGKKK